MISFRSLKAQSRISSRIDEIRREASLKLNLGCGAHPQAGFVNVDLYSDLADEKLDVLDLNLHADGTVDLIESHHLFEHLSFEDGVRGLQEWRRALKPGGHLILTCPNLSYVAAKWMQQTVMIWMGIKVDRSYTERMLYGPQTNPGMFHRAGYDDRSLRQLIEQSGYMVELSHTPYPIRPTPSMLVIARKL